MDYTFSSTIEQFPMKGGWYFVRLPDDFVLRPGITKTRYGFVPITATIGETSWETSLLPMGDTTFFIALKADVRKKKLSLQLGNKLTVGFIYKK